MIQVAGIRRPNMKHPHPLPPLTKQGMDKVEAIKDKVEETKDYLQAKVAPTQVKVKTSNLCL